MWTNADGQVSRTRIHRVAGRSRTRNENATNPHVILRKRATMRGVVRRLKGLPAKLRSGSRVKVSGVEMKSNLPFLAAPRFWQILRSPGLPFRELPSLSANGGRKASLFYTNLTCLNYHADFSTSRYCPAPRSTPEIPPACPADRSVSRYEKRSKCAGRPRTTLTILRPHRRGRNGGRVPFRSRLRAFKWRPCSSTDRPAGFQRWWRSSGRSEKPNDPPGKPAGFVCNNEAVRPAVELRFYVDGEPHGRTHELPTSLANPPRASRPPFASSLWASPRASWWGLRMTAAEHENLLIPSIRNHP